VARKEVTTGRTEDPRKDYVPLGCSGRTTLRREQCDEFGVSYATIFQIHGASDVDIATQRSGTDLASPTPRFSKCMVQI
jgi:hypothetical protein